MKYLDSYFQPVEVIVKDGDINSALKKLKGKVYSSGKIKELYDRRHYVKPSAKRRKEIIDAEYRQKKKLDSEKVDG